MPRTSSLTAYNVYRYTDDVCPPLALATAEAVSTRTLKGAVFGCARSPFAVELVHGELFCRAALLQGVAFGPSDGVS
jgi:hypothetical protein